MTKNTDSVLNFPCEFHLKTFGKANDAFEKAVLTIVKKYVPNLSENAIKQRPSKDGNYLALTIVITATSQQQLDSIYQELSSHELVIMAL